MAKHSNLGPSAAERWWNCPGSVALLAKLPRGVSSIHAVEGTVAHGLVEKFVTGQIKLKALMALIGTTIEEQGFKIEVTDEMIDAVIEFNDLIVADKKALETERPDLLTEGRAEVRVYAKSVSPDLYGTADYILWQKGRKLKVYDFKYGKGVVVDPEENKQMAIYALAAMETLAGEDFEEVELVIVQPRAGGDSVRRWPVPQGWSREFYDGLVAAVKRVDDDKAPIVAGKWCKWCAVKPACPAAFKSVQEQAMVDFAEPAPEIPVADITKIPLERQLQALEWQEHVEGMFSAIRANIKGMLEAGLPVPGYKLVEGKSNRKFIDESKVIESFEPLLGAEALFEPRKLISPAKLEKIVGKAKVAEFTFKPEGGKSIAKDSDARPAAKNSAERDFAPALPEPSKGVTIDDLEPPKEADALTTELFGLEAKPAKKREPMWPV